MSSKEDSRILGSDFPALEVATENGKTMKEAFESYLKKKTVDESKIWIDIEDCIRQVVHSAEKFLITEVICLK